MGSAAQRRCATPSCRADAARAGQPAPAGRGGLADGDRAAARARPFPRAHGVQGLHQPGAGRADRASCSARASPSARTPTPAPASTDTIYQLDLPRNDAALVDESLGILSEIAGRLTLAADQIEPERGVILSEKRVRDTPEPALVRGHARLPAAGLALCRARADRPRARDPHRPARAVRRVLPRLVHARSAAWSSWPETSQPAAVRAAIEAHFGQPARSRRAPPPIRRSEPSRITRPGCACWSAIPGLPTSVALNFVLPYDIRPDSLPSRATSCSSLLAGAMLQPAPGEPRAAARARRSRRPAPA